jgi:hypothetical protein
LPEQRDRFPLYYRPLCGWGSKHSG